MRQTLVSQIYIFLLVHTHTHTHTHTRARTYWANFISRVISSSKAAVVLLRNVAYVRRKSL